MSNGEATIHVGIDCEPMADRWVLRGGSGNRGVSMREDDGRMGAYRGRLMESIRKAPVGEGDG